MELHQLKALIAIAETGQLTRAADRLHLSQPAVSAQIKALEEELEQRLFERTPSGMTPTRASRDLIPYAERAIAAIEAMRTAAKAMRAGVAAKIRIGSVNDPQALRLGEFLGRVSERHALLELEISHDLTGRILERVRAGELDAGFYLGTLDDPRIGALPLGELGYCIAGPAAWKSKLAKADWPEIIGMPWVLPLAPSTLREWAIHALQTHGGRPAKVTEAETEPVILNLVESGLGLGFVRVDAATERVASGEMAIWGTARWSIPVSFIYPRQREGEPAIAALLAVLRELWASSPERAPVA